MKEEPGYTNEQKTREMIDWWSKEGITSWKMVVTKDSVIIANKKKNKKKIKRKENIRLSKGVNEWAW